MRSKIEILHDMQTEVDVFEIKGKEPTCYPEDKLLLEVWIDIRDTLKGIEKKLDTISKEI